MPTTLLILETGFPDLQIERTATDAAGIDLVTADASTPEEVIATLEELDRSIDGIMTQYTPITAEVFAHAPALSVVGRYGIGVDNVDLESATEHEVVVLNVPDYCVEEVTSHAFALILSLARKVTIFDSAVSNGTWDWSIGKPMHRLAGQTLGFAGFGNIPRRLQEKVAGFDFELVAYDPYQSRASLNDYGVEKVGFDELLETADIITVHTPLTDETRGLFDASAFEAMKQTALLVNTSRGGVINIDELHHALAEGEIAGVGLDVLPEEPPTELALRDLDNVILTPHVAWYSEASIRDLRQTLVDDVARCLEGGTAENPVNNT